jgi:hypothetical protein
MIGAVARDRDAKVPARDLWILAALIAFALLLIWLLLTN